MSKELKHKNSIVKPDKNLLWPVYGRQDDKDLQQTKKDKFWLKDKQVISKEYDVTIQGKLSRVGKKEKQVKQYFYYIQGCYLCYKEKPTDKIIKGYLKLGPNIKMERKYFAGKKEDIYFIEFSKNGNIRKIYSKDQLLVNDWYKEVKKHCVQTKILNIYSQMDRLGSGSFSTVFKMIRKEDNKAFAGKFYYKEKFEESKNPDKFVQMMKNEYAVIKKMDHPNIIKIHELFQDQQQVVYIMDHITGGEIYERLKKIKQFPEDECALIIRQIADALYFLHQEQIVHRDLKLENILFTSENSSEIKLIDFGFAEKINRQKLVSRAGTPGFLPPELFKLSPYTEKGDIFSLGVIFYSMLVGSTPFRGETYKNVVDNNKHCRVNYEHDHLKKYSEDCISCLKCLLDPNPDDNFKRYSAEDIIHDQWIQKYYPLDADSQYGDTQSLAQQFVYKSSMFIKTESSQMSYMSSMNVSQFNSNFGSEHNPKSLYRYSNSSYASKRSCVSRGSKVSQASQFKSISEQDSSSEDGDNKSNTKNSKKNKKSKKSNGSVKNKKKKKNKKCENISSFRSCEEIMVEDKMSTIQSIMPKFKSFLEKN